MLLSRVGKKSKLTAHQTKTSKLTLSCSSLNIFVQEIKEKLTLESLNKRQTRRARPSSPRSTPLSLLLSSNERPISVTCQGSDCMFQTTFRSRAHGLGNVLRSIFIRFDLNVVLPYTNEYLGTAQSTVPCDVIPAVRLEFACVLRLQNVFKIRR